MHALGASRAERAGTREAMAADADAHVDVAVVERAQVELLALHDDEAAAERHRERAARDLSRRDELPPLLRGVAERGAEDRAGAVAQDDGDRSGGAVGERHVPLELQQSLRGNSRRTP